MLCQRDALAEIIASAERRAIEIVLKDFLQNQPQLCQAIKNRDMELKKNFQNASAAEKINFPEIYRKQMRVVLEKYDKIFYKQIIKESNTILEKQFKCMNNGCYSSLGLIYHGCVRIGLYSEVFEHSHDIFLFFHAPELSYRYNCLSCNENFYPHKKGDIYINRVRCSKCGKWFCYRCIIMLGDEARERYKMEYICPDCISRMNLPMY